MEEEDVDVTTFFLASMTWHCTKGGDPNGLLEGSMNTMTRLAAICTEGDAEAIVQAIAMGADPSCRRSMAACLFFKNSDALMALLQCGADRDLPIPEQVIIDTIMRLCEKKRNQNWFIDKVRKYGSMPPFHLSILFECPPLFQSILMLFGVDHTALTSKGRTLKGVIMGQERRDKDTHEKKMMDGYYTSSPKETCARLNFCCGCRSKKDPDDVKNCSGCNLVSYCNSECQKKNWEAHRPMCQRRSAVLKKYIKT